MGKSVKAQVLAIDTEKRQLRLGMKQLVPSGLDEYIAEHKEGDVVTGRMIEVSDRHAPRGTGRRHSGQLPMHAASAASSKNCTAAPDHPSRSRVTPNPIYLRWGLCCKPAGRAERPLAVLSRKQSARTDSQVPIAKLDPAAKKIELELA